MKHPPVVLSRFRIRAYRSCKSTTLDLPTGLAVLIGPNGSGKTNILNALLLLRLARRRWARQAENDSFALRCQIAAEFRLKDKKKIRYKASVVYRPDEENKDQIQNVDEKWNLADITREDKWLTVPELALQYAHVSRDHRVSPFEARGTYYYIDDPDWVHQKMRLYSSHFGSGRRRKSTAKKSLAIAKELEHALGAIGSLRQEIAYYSASQFTNPSLCPTSFEVDADGDLRDRFPSRAGPQARFMYDLYKMHISNEALYQAYMSLVDKNGVRLLDGIKWNSKKFSSKTYEVRAGGKVVNEWRKRTLIVPTVRIGESQLSFNQLSEGTFRTLALIFYVVTDQSKLLLLEEPEVCVHHGLLSSLIEIIKRYSDKKQIICSTHSEAVVDRLAPEQLLLVTRDTAEGTLARPLNKAVSHRDYSALKNFLETSGNLGEYWKQSGFED